MFDVYKTWCQALEKINDEQLPPKPNEFDIICVNEVF
jgi:hypothetical protein